MSHDEEEIERLKVENIKLFEELKRKKAKLTSTLKELEEKNFQLAAHHRDLTDSVNYAKRIQMAIMPPRYVVNKLLEESFILYLPKDVVSGDFYFVHRIKDEVVFAVVDCTGHGVPGALMSVVGFNCLDQAVSKLNMTVPCEILSFLDEGVNDTLRQTADESGVKDGMDLAMCTFNAKKKELQYSGAYNPLYVIKKVESFVSKKERKIDVEHPREIKKQLVKASKEKAGVEVSVVTKNENNHWIGGVEEVINHPAMSLGDHHLFEIKADKLPIGVNLDGVVDIYTNHTVPVEKGDAIYLFTDGYADQFGGPMEKKFKYHRLKELLLSIQDKTMIEQKRILVRTFSKWKGDEDQIDDVLVMGLRV